MQQSEQPSKLDVLIEDTVSSLDFIVHMGVGSIVPNSLRLGPLSKYHYDDNEAIANRAKSRFAWNQFYRAIARSVTVATTAGLYLSEVIPNVDSSIGEDIAIAFGTMYTIMDGVFVAGMSGVPGKKDTKRFELSFIPLDLIVEGAKVPAKYIRRINSKSSPVEDVNYRGPELTK